MPLPLSIQLRDLPAQILDDIKKHVGDEGKFVSVADAIRTACRKMLDQLDQIDTVNIEPLASPLEKTAKTRTDNITAKNRKEVFLERSPKSNDDYFLVPRVVE